MITLRSKNQQTINKYIIIKKYLDWSQWAQFTIFYWNVITCSKNKHKFTIRFMKMCMLSLHCTSSWIRIILNLWAYARYTQSAYYHGTFSLHKETLLPGGGSWRKLWQCWIKIQLKKLKQGGGESFQSIFAELRLK